MTSKWPNIDWTLLEIFASGHYGFGQYDSPLWLVGPGFDCLGGTPDEISARLVAWHRRGQRELDDLRDFFLASGDSELFGDNPHIQRTWGRLCRFLLAASSSPVSDETVRRYQADRFGRRTNKACVIQLLATNPDITPWPFYDSPSPFLASAESFAERYTPRRARHISSRIRRNRPKLTVFFDRTHRDLWEQIAGTPFTESSLPSCYASAARGTHFLVLRHPESVGTTNDYFVQAGEMAAELLSV